jgi:predicted DNA-binding transcriptional regulator YafY
MDQLRRLFGLVSSLARNRFPLSAARLAEEHEVPAATIARDMAQLALLGAPVEGDATLGYMLVPGVTAPPLMLDAAEIDALRLGAQHAAASQDAATSAAAQRALAKLDAARELVRFGPWTAQRKGSVEPLRLLARRAICDERALLITYRDGDALPTQRTILPLQLAHLQAAHIIAAWCCLRQDFRHFRLAQRWIDALEADEPEIAAALHISPLEDQPYIIDSSL